MTKINNLLSLFNLRKIEIELYEALFYGGMMRASQLAKQINISRTSVYDLLERLMQAGLIIESMRGGVKIFTVQPLEKIQLLLKEKESSILSARDVLDDLRQEYLTKHKAPTPRLQLFNGRQELQQMMKDMLLYSDITVYAFWPIKKMVALLTPSFLEKFHQERAAQNINIKVIWPKKQIPLFEKYPYLATGSEWKREVRIAPVEMSFSLGYAVYGNTIRFISSRKESFGFLVESNELTEMMKNQFQAMWKISKPLKNKRIIAE